MPRHVEPLTGGLVTSKDPALLQEGQLSEIRNAYYRRGATGLRYAEGRVGYATADGNPVPILGLRSIKYDNGGHFLIAQVSGQQYQRMGVELEPAGNVLKGSITDTTLITGKTLEAIHYQNQWYLLNGAVNNTDTPSTNRVVFLSATATDVLPGSRPHGLLPVKDTPEVVTSATAAGVAVTGYYEYWTTEVREYTVDGRTVEVESGFVGKPATVNISSLATAAVVRKPDRVNDFANRWRVYRSSKKNAENDVAFPSGDLISSDMSVSITTFTDTPDGTGGAFFLPGSFNTSPQPYSGWASATNLSATGGGYAVSTMGTSGGNTQGCYGFSFSGISGNLRGLEVEVLAYTDISGTPLSVLIGTNRGSDGFFTTSAFRAGLRGGKRSKFGSKSANVTAVSAPGQTITFGGSGDLWVAPGDQPFSSSDLNSTFMVVLQHSQPSTVMNVDYVRVKAYTGGSIQSAIPFPTVVYQIGTEAAVEIARNGPPPSSSTGDVFGSQLVVNDVKEPANLKYSYPDSPDAFPGTYYLPFDYGVNDKITLIKVINNRLVVCLENSTYRVNYLPSEVDASFDRERAIETISSTYGCVGPMCATKLSITGLGEQLAFVSHAGIHITDGQTFETITEDLDWSKVISKTNPSECIALINNTEKHDLVFYYRNDDDPNKTYLALHFNYAPEHLTNGKLKISGPVDMRNYSDSTSTFSAITAAWPAIRKDGSTKVFLGFGPSPAGPQYATASADITDGSWLRSSDGTNTDLYTMIDETETEINDADYIYIADNGASPTCTIGLSSVTDPLVANDHVVRVRLNKTGGISSTGDYVTVALSDGTTTFFTRNALVFSTGLNTFEWKLTDTEATNIGSYSTLRASFTFVSSTSAGANQFRVVWFNFKVPTLGSQSSGAGVVYIEQGSSLPVQDPAMSYSTRRMYLAGVGNEMRVNKLRGYSSNVEGTPTIAYSLKTSKTGFAGESVLTSPELQLDGSFLHRVNVNQACEGLTVNMESLADHNDMTHEFIVIEGDGFGEESSGL